MIFRLVPRIYGTASVLLAVILSTCCFADTLNVQFSSEPTQYDPLMLEDGTSLRISANTIATPYEYSSSGDLVKALVENVSISRDRKHYVFRFRKGLKWSDGQAFHAKQFVLALQRLVKEPVKVALSELFPSIDLQNTRALDARSAQVALKTPDAMFLHWCTLPPFAPIREDMIESYQKHTPVVPTLAAYQVTDYKREDQLVLKKNPNFYDADHVAIDEVKIRFIGDEAALLPLLKSGGLDVLSKVPVLQLKEILAVAHLGEYPVEAVTYLGLNTHKAPFNELKNRQAFRDAVAQKIGTLAEVLKTGEKPALFMLPEILWPRPMSRRAPAHLPDGIDPKLTFSMQSDSGSRNQTILEYIQSRLGDDYRWKPKLELLDWKTHYSKLKTDPAEVYRFGWQNPVGSPYVLYQVFQSKSPNNFTGWSNAEYDSLVNQLRQETREVKKADLVEKIETILWNEAPAVPLLHQVLRFAWSKKVDGFRANAFGVVLFRDLKLQK